MGLFKNYVNQTRKPEGFLGKMMLGGMNTGHAKLADWGFTHLPAIHPDSAVDLGCGGGRNAGELLKMYPKAHVTAVDYSELSVEKAKEYNKAMISAGRCDVLQGDVSDLPLSADSFDLATAFETVYFWPGPVKSFSEVCRILKPGGRFLIVNESDGMDKTGKQFETIIDGMHTYTAEELEAALQAAGFAQVKTAHHPQKPWLAILATKGE
jgi:ubiquinone/menaquinone biosynthesis C-methylase UbiE